jgi:predicted signal transduction protein with EAL and GGDEF domain
VTARKGDGTIRSEREGGWTSNSSAGALVELPRALAELEPGATAEGALAAADLAMYEAKQNGRDRFAAFSPELHGRVEAGRSLTEQIRGALERDGFVLYGQPVLDLHTNAVAQHELLVRMRGEGDQVIPAGSLLPIAERFDLVQAIDRWVIVQAIRLIEERRGRGDAVRVAVNLSGRSIAVRRSPASCRPSSSGDRSRPTTWCSR